MISSRIYIGDCVKSMQGLPDASVHCCVTSPPYFGLRDYGVDGQLGLESTVDEFVAALVRVFDEVRRVLRDDGTLWLNLGDTYSQPGQQNRNRNGINTEFSWLYRKGVACEGVKIDTGIPAKNLIGIPWSVAFALRAAGWYLRQDIIWHKPNPMPESVRDRCTKAHEYLFLMSKSSRYYYDADAIAEPAGGDNGSRFDTGKTATHQGERMQRGPRRRSGNDERKSAKGRGCPNEGVAGKVPWEGDTRNKRSVWSVTTKPFPGAHFAVFPPDLIEPCVLAGCPEGGTVLDPFAGSGTTGVVATAHGRNFIGCELNPEYAAMAERRIAEARSPSCYRSDEVGDAPLFAEESA